jgi:hypothetical protein
MVTVITVKEKIQGLIAKSNNTTGNSDTTLTDAVDALVEGYGSGDGEAVLTELVVTENGVYDKPVIGGALDFSVGKTVTFKKVITIEDIPMEYRPSEGEGMKTTPVPISPDHQGGIIVAENGAIIIQFMPGPDTIHMYSDAVAAASGGYPLGWSIVDVSSDTVVLVEEPPCGVIVDETAAQELAKLSFLFEAPSTPADGWNKVTVNVACDIVDVDELPTENIEEGKIYRVTKEGESVNDIYVVASGDGISCTLQEVLAATAYPAESIMIYPVDELPATGDPALPNESGGFAVLPVYVIRSTGEGHVYLDLSYHTGFMELGEMLELGIGSKGVISNTSEATEDGYYFLTYQSQPSTTYGIPNAHPVKRLVDGAWVEL